MKKQGSKGITLIALVITIIIMLILVVVTIDVATDGGLIKKANQAKEDTQAKANEERDLTSQKMADKIDAAVNGETKKYQDTIKGLPEGETSVPQKELSGDLKDAADKGKIIAVIEDGEMLAPIPQGFTISNVDGEKRISTGLVIKDNAGNEFVWVPVKDVIYDGTTSIEENYKPMAKLQSGSTTNYEGVLYDFSGIMSTEKESYGITTTCPYREPVALEEAGDTAKGITTEKMQSTFNSMVESVSKYGGFYVGRYETTNMDSSKITVKPEIQKGINNQTWHAMYEKAKTLTTNYVQSEMIWGCEWDAMLNWMLTGAQASKVDSGENGNHSSELANTGATSTDVINNVYDLEGNNEEWTQEAEGILNRILRGGDIYFCNTAGDRFPENASSENNISLIGLRVTLYIK